MTTTVASLRAEFKGDNTDLIKKAKEVQNVLKQTQAQVRQNMALQRESDRYESNLLKSQQQQMKSFASVQRQKYAEMQKYSLANQYQQISKGVNAAAMGMAKFAAAGVAVGYAAKQVYEFGKSGAQIEYTQIKFDRLARSVGTTGGLFIKDLRGATRGTVSDFKLLEQGSNLLQLGLARDSKEATRLSSVMTALGMDTGELTLALANQSKRRLDQLGLSLVKFNEIEAKLKASGMGKEEAFKEAFMQTAEQTVATTGNMADSKFGKYQQFEAAGQNLIDDAKLSVGSALLPTVQGVAQFLTGMRELQAGQRVFDWGAMFSGQDSWVRQGGVQDQSSLWSNRGRGERNRAITGLSAAQNYTAMAYSYRQGGGGGPQQEAAPDLTNYDALLSGSLQLTSATEQLTQARADLNAQLLEEQKNLTDLRSRGYGETSSKVKEVKGNITELRGEVEKTDDAQVDMVDQLMMANIAAASSEEERAKKQLEYARATGKISQEAYNQQSALMGIAGAFAAGEVTAEQAAKAAQLVMDKLDMLDGMSVEAIINLVVNGQIPSFTAFSPNADLKDVNKKKKLGDSGETTANAGGGPLTDVTIVGDAPGGVWTPYTEVVANGYVYNNKQARKMKEAGLLDGAKVRGMGGPIGLDTGEMLTLGGGYRVTPGNIGNSGGGGGSSGGGGGYAAQVVSSIVAPVVRGVAQEVTAQSVSLATSVGQMTIESRTMNKTLMAILAKLVTAPEIGMAVNSDRSKFS